MILHELSVEGFRTFANAMTIGPFDERITVIHAPNGTGKSTLLDAFCYGLLESHAVTGAGIENLVKSAGRDISPRVGIVFESGGTRYKLEKRFLKGGEARLARLEGGQFVSLADGAEASQFTRELLMADAPGKGLIKRTEHFGLGSILWSAQNGVDLTALQGAALNHVRARVGGAAASVGEGDARAAAFAGDWYAHFFTKGSATKGPTEAKGSKSADLPRLRANVAAAKAYMSAAQTALEEIETLRTAYDMAVANRARAAKLAAEYEADMERRRAGVTAYEKALQQSESAAAAVKLADERYDGALKLTQRIASTRLALAELERDHARTSWAAQRVREADAQSRAGVAQLQQRVDSASREVEVAGQGAQVARNAAAYRAAKSTSRELTRRLTELAELRETLDAVRSERVRLSAPDAATLNAIRDAGAELRRLRDALESCVVHVEFEAASSSVLALTVGQSADSLSPAGGQIVNISGSPAVEVAIQGVGVIRARGPYGTYGQILHEMRLAEERHTDAMRPFGTTDIVELERRGEHAVALDRQAASLEERVADRERDGDSKTMHDRVVTNDAAVAALEERYAQWAAHEPDAAALAVESEQRLTLARQARLAAAEALAVASAEAEATTASFHLAQEAVAATERDVEKAKGQLQAFESDGLLEADRDAASRTLGLAVLAAQQAAAEAQTALDAFAEDPRPGFAGLQRRLDVAIADRGDAMTSETRTEAILNVKMQAGAYEAYALAEIEVAECERLLRTEEFEARAARLLHETFLEVEKKREETVLAPVRQRTAELYRRVSGVASETVHLESDMTLKGLERGGACILSTLSGGEREQLGLLSRLALADLIADGERELVILDDSLTATDPHRFERFLTIVEEFAEQRMQFVIATCDKMRYASLEHAKFVDLGDLRSAVAAS